MLAAREKGLATIGYLGGEGGQLEALVDMPVGIGAPDTATIQAGHLVLTHTICGLVEEALFPHKAVFLDRDGTLIVNRHYGSDPDAIELLDGVPEGLRALREAGYKLILVSNQSGVARGYFDEAAIGRMHDKLQKMLDVHGAGLDGLEYCPHHPGRALRHGVCVPQARPRHDPSRRPHAWPEPLRLVMVGDIAADVEAGERAGARTVLVGPEPSPLPPDFRAAGFGDVVGHILGEGAGTGLEEKAGSAASARL